MRIQSLIHTLLVLLIFALCGQIFATWRRPVPSVSMDDSASSSSPPAIAPLSPPLTQEGINGLVTTIMKNDLFSPDRGKSPPPVVAEDTQKKIDPPSHLKLVGVVLTRHRAEAFLSDTSQGNKVVRVKQGDSIGQYQLLQVTPVEVKLSLGVGGEVAPLRLQILDSATSQQAPRLVPQVAARNLGSVQQNPSAGRGALASADPNQPAAPAAPEEAQALRDNIQRMQQRLRRIRRRAAREEAAARGENVSGGDEENGEEEDEEE